MTVCVARASALGQFVTGSEYSDYVAENGRPSVDDLPPARRMRAWSTWDDLPAVERERCRRLAEAIDRL